MSAAIAFKLACQSPEVFIPRANVVAWAKANGNWNGADPMSANQEMQAAGMVDAAGNQWGEGPANYVALSDQAAMEAALDEGPLSVTVSANQLDPVAGMANGWILTGALTDQAYDHEPAISKYGTFATLAPLVGASLGSIDPSTYGYILFTWGTVGLIDRKSLLAIGQDALLALPTAVAQGTGPIPAPEPNPSPSPSRRATDLRAIVEEIHEREPETAEHLLAAAEALVAPHAKRLGCLPRKPWPPGPHPLHF